MLSKSGDHLEENEMRSAIQFPLTTTKFRCSESLPIYSSSCVIASVEPPAEEMAQGSETNAGVTEVA
jgi:hypothetical protein